MFKLREEWLKEASKMFREEWIKFGVEVPADAVASAGFPGGGSPRSRIGECWPRARSARKVNEIWINPTLDDATQVADVLGHELLHAVDDCKSGHRAAFTANSKRVGYSGGKHSQATTDDAKRLISDIVALCGPYPHGKLDITKRKQKESSGLHGCECGCGNKVYVTAAKVAEFGLPSCANCGEQFHPVGRGTKNTKIYV